MLISSRIRSIVPIISWAVFSLLPIIISTAEAQPIQLRIGVISGLTGAAAKWCTFQNMGMRLAQEDLKQEGIDIELLFEDSKSLATKVISAYTKLVSLDKVDAVIADDFGFVIAPLLPVVEKDKQTLVTLSLSDARYCKLAPTRFFSVASNLQNSQRAYERFFELNPDIKRIGLVAFDDPEWGHMYLEIWRQLAKRRGLSIVDTFLRSDFNPDFKSALTRMRPKNPDAILFAHEPNGMLKAAAQLKINHALVTANIALELLVESGVAPPELNGVYIVDPAISDDFRKKFMNRFAKAPILEAYTGMSLFVRLPKPR